MIHKLKTWPEYYKEVENGNKTFEVRKFDRPFKVGDTLLLQEWDNETEQYTGNEMPVTITYILGGNLMMDGFCIMAIKGDVSKEYTERDIKTYGNAMFWYLRQNNVRDGELIAGDINTWVDNYFKQLKSQPSWMKTKPEVQPPLESFTTLQREAIPNPAFAPSQSNEFDRGEDFLPLNKTP